VPGEGGRLSRFAEAFAGQFDPISVVYEPIENGIGNSGIADALWN
jgi:hypothetical protein